MYFLYETRIKDFTLVILCFFNLNVRLAMLDKEILDSLKNWRELVSSYKIPDNKKAVFQILNTFIPFVGLWTLMYFSLNWSIWITMAIGLVNALFLVRIFIIQHDCGHQSFSSSRKANKFIGKICSCFSSLPFSYWAKIHNFHHGHNGQIEVWDIGDIPTLTVDKYKQKSWLGKVAYRIWRMPIVTFVIAPIYYFSIANRIPTYTKKMKNAKRMVTSLIKDNLLIVIVYVALSFLFGWKFLFIQFFLIFTFGIIAFWFFYVQHQHERSYKQLRENWDYLLSAIKGSSYYKLPRVFQWLTGNIGIHHIHHLNSLIPNYNLPKALKDHPILTKYATTISFRESLSLMKHKLWDEVDERMVSFREASRLIKLRVDNMNVATAH